jgi:4-diphosphocytidyl-2-C-methyl-D-erythritol kinase
MEAARVVAQAKTNLFLHVLAREAGGYHQLETLFCRLELGDDVTVRVGMRARTLDCRGAIPPGGLGPVERNLAWRAAAAFADAAAWPSGFAIEIDKRIPVGGGLGGGSADAGAVLRCLNALAPVPLSLERLLGIAAALGADVPFLAMESALALAWGRGERMLSLAPHPRCAVRLHCFAFGVPTADAYGWLASERAGLGQATASPRVFSLDRLATWGGVAASVGNDFECVVPSHFPAIAETLAALRARADPSASLVLLSGSGATVVEIDADERGFLPQRTSATRALDTHTATRVADVLRLEH